MDVTVGEIGAVVATDIAETGAREGGFVADFAGYVFGDVAEVMIVRSENFDGVWIVGVGRFCLESAFKLAKVAVDIVTMGHASDIELNDVELADIIWPDGDVIAFVFYAKVFEFLDGRIRVTATDNDLYF